MKRYLKTLYSGINLLDKSLFFLILVELDEDEDLDEEDIVDVVNEFFEIFVIFFVGVEKVWNFMGFFYFMLILYLWKFKI